MAQPGSILPGMNNLHPDAKRLGLKKTRLSGKAFSRILSYAGRQKKYVAAAVAIATIGCVLDVTAPFLMSQAIDAMIGPGRVNFSTILLIAMVLVIMYVISSAFSRLTNYLSAIVAAKTAAELREEGFSQISRLPLKFFDHTEYTVAL